MLHFTLRKMQNCTFEKFIWYWDWPTKSSKGSADPGQFISVVWVKVVCLRCKLLRSYLVKVNLNFEMDFCNRDGFFKCVPQIFFYIRWFFKLEISYQEREEFIFIYWRNNTMQRHVDIEYLISGHNWILIVQIHPWIYRETACIQ